MSKKIVFRSNLISGFVNLLSISAIVTVVVLISLRNNIINSKNLKIEPYSGTISTSQSDIDTMISNTDPLNNRVAALSKLFKGVTEKNINNFLVEKASNETITLIANEEYFFNSEDIKTVSANYKIVEIIDVTPKTGVINILQVDFDAITSDDLQTKITALSKLFDGVTETNLSNFTVEKTSDIEITLHANEGFAFGSDATSSIKVDVRIVTILNISVKPGTLNVTNKDIVDMLLVQNTPEKLTALSKLFEGIDSTNIANIEAEQTSSTVITLKANPGYAFGSTAASSLTADISIVSIINISIKSITSNITEADVQAMLSTTNSIGERVTALSKLFDGVTETNLSNFTVEKTSATVITLKANPGYAFGTATESSISSDIRIITILNIIPNNGITNILQSDFDSMSSNDLKTKVTALSKIFTGVTEGNVNNFVVEKTNKAITLKANQGFSFVSSVITTIKADIVITTILNITAKPGTHSVTSNDILDMISLSNPTARLAALSKLFNGLDDKNIVNVVANRTSDKLITLQANSGFAFGSIDVTSITADIEISSVLTIFQKSPTATNVSQKNVDDMTSTTNSLRERVNALSLLFNGITEVNINNIIVTKTSDTVITLNTKSGYIFSSNATSLTANIQIITVLSISAKSGTADVSPDDVNNMTSPTASVAAKAAALTKLFSGVNVQNVINVTAKKTSDTLITLEANPGFIFSSNTTTLTANIRIITILNISVRAGTHNLLQSEVDTIVSNSASAANKLTILNKLFSGIVEADITKFTITRSSNATITLNANSGFAFGSANITSLTANIKVITILNITPKGGKLKMTETDFRNLSSPNNTDKIRTLSILFNGVNSNNINNFYININSQTEVTLRANEGFAFNSITNFSVKVNFEVFKIIDVTRKAERITVTQWEVNLISNLNNPAPQRLNVLNRLFNGVTINNINLFRPELTPHGRDAIFLYANSGYGFVDEYGIYPFIGTNVTVVNRFADYEKNNLFYKPINSDKKNRK
ncbi:MAG: hypothetical protein ACRC9U_02045 [Metamycoplasmataceae bacterium]